MINQNINFCPYCGAKLIDLLEVIDPAELERFTGCIPKGCLNPDCSKQPYFYLKKET